MITPLSSTLYTRHDASPIQCLFLAVSFCPKYPVIDSSLIGLSMQLSTLLTAPLTGKKIPTSIQRCEEDGVGGAGVGEDLDACADTHVIS